MNATILNWDNANHKAIYESQLQENPLYYDPDLKLWVAYSYEYCKALLLHPDAQVPAPVINEGSLLNRNAKLLLHKMARVSNNDGHNASRAAAMMMYQRINRVQAGQLLEALLKETDTGKFDWVEVVCKQLPVRLILKGLGFCDDDSIYISTNLAALVRLMSPNKTDRDVEILNPAADGVWEIAERYITVPGQPADEETKELLICNVIGLMIQCYDAGRGLLCNMLLNMAGYNDRDQMNKNDHSFYEKLVNETLRFDPPVHNTRRTAVKDITLGDKTLRAGDAIMITIAAANLDPQVFKHPLEFDIDRINNDQHLTFGCGGHNCLAKYFCIDMAADTCGYLAGKYQNITIHQKELYYEPQLNVRLVKQLMISLS